MTVKILKNIKPKQYTEEVCARLIAVAQKIIKRGDKR